MSGTVKSKLSFLSVIVIAFFVLLQMGLYLAHQIGDINLQWGLFQYCLTALKKNSLQHRLLDFLFYGLIAYTTLKILLRIIKQSYLTWKLEKRIEVQKDVRATKRLKKKYREWGIEIAVIRDRTFLALAMGIFRPKILLSTHVLDCFTEQEVEAILLHEWHHCKNRDPLKLFLVILFTDSMKYVPVLKGLAHHYKVWRELLADRFVIHRMGSAYELGSVLLKLTGQEHRQFAAGVSFADVAINYRIQQMIEPSRPIRVPVLRGKPTLQSIVVVLIFMSFILGGCA